MVDGGGNTLWMTPPIVPATFLTGGALRTGSTARSTAFLIGAVTG